MTRDRLRELIAAGESLSVEFKGEERAPLADRELVETVVCLTNRSGQESGWLLVGVEDDGRLTGARDRHGEGTDPLRVQALIANQTRPSLSCRATVVELEGKAVLAIEVPPSRLPVGTAGGRYLRRAVGGRGGPECLPFHFHEMQALQADRGSLDYSALVVPGARWDDLDPLEFARLRRMISESRGGGDRTLLNLSDLEVAKALGAIEANHEVRAIRVQGLLLFGKESALRDYLPTAEAAFQVLRDHRVEVNEFFRWPLLRLLEELESRFRARNREEEVHVGLLRVAVPDYPERAFREGVANALLHRDYTRLGAVHVQWREAELEISSPGGFPEGVTLTNLLVTPPRPRNPLLADAFKRIGLVERTARGVDTIFYEQLRNGRPAPSYERSTGSGVVLILPGGEASLDFARLVAEETMQGRTPGLDELLVLNALWQQRHLDAQGTAALIQKSEAEARAILEALAEEGLAEARGSTRARRYHLSAATCRRLDAASAYVRQRGFEPLQQEQMVLQYVKSHGRITRSEVAELCRLSSHQASRLLRRLVAEEKLAAQGSGRGSWYGLARKQ